MYYVIGKTDCPFCDKAKALLDSTNTPYVYKNLSILPKLKKEAWLEFIKNDLSMKTVPVIFNVIGGYEELERLS